MKPMNCHRLLVCIPAAAILWCSLATPEEAKKADDLAAEIRSLQKERIAILQQAVHLSRTMYEGGRRNFEPVVRTHLELLDAELDGAETVAERIKLLSTQLKMTDESVELTKQLFELGKTSNLEYTQAKALQIRIKISLLKSRQEQQAQEVPKRQQGDLSGSRCNQTPHQPPSSAMIPPSPTVGGWYSVSDDSALPPWQMVGPVPERAQFFGRASVGCRWRPFVSHPREGLW
jgi:hypothetical protein